MAEVNEYKTIIENLSGKQSISIPVAFRKNGVLIADPLDVIVRGFLKFEDAPVQITPDGEEILNELEDKTVVYPVVFSSDTIRISSGQCVVVLLPRSEDLFEETQTVQERAAESVADSDIVSQGGVREDEQITEPDKIPVVIKIEKDKIREPYKISLQITITSVDDQSFYVQTIDRGTDPKIETTTGAKSLFQKETTRIPSNLIIDCQADLEWIPAVKSILGNNNSSQNTILSEINDLKNSTPLGTSTMYDAVVAGARILSDDTVDNSKKNIYVFTDNEANTSLASIQNAIDETNDIDGNKDVPLMVGNMAISDTATLSVKANRSDTKNINQLAFETGGQSVTVIDESFLDDIVGIFYRSAVGSMGYGTYEFIKDFGAEVLINRISATFDIPSFDSNATWSIETSLDGYNYTAIDLTYNATDSITFENLLVRYIRFKIIMVTGISSAFVDEYGTTPDTPSLDLISVVFNANKVAYLYLNKEDVDIPPYQITLAVDANEINNDQIKVGVAKSDAISWTDFSTESQPVVDQNGKVIIPIRFSQDVTEFEHEPLRKIDNFATKTKYGRWDQNARVIIYDKNNSPMSTDDYEVYPREGRVIFNAALPSDYQDGDFKIGVLNIGQYKVGLKLTNKTENDTLDIVGIGYEYTTGKDLLPPISKAAPEVQQVAVVNDFPNRFSIVELTYIYFDSNFDPEDTTQRVITWYINGESIPALDNSLQWNDINDPADPVYSQTSLKYPDAADLEGLSVEDWAKRQTISLIKADDVIYAEVQVSDGDSLSDKGASAPVTVVESPPIITAISLKGRDSDGNIVSRVTTSTDLVIDPPLDESFFSDSGGENNSEITWYVNGDLFKTGIVGETVPGGIPIEEIRVNEIATGTLIDYGLRIGNSIFIEIIPKTGGTTGELVTTDPIIVQNSLPQVFDLEFLTNVFTPSNDIILQWIWFDFETISLSDVDETFQSDQSMVKLFRKNPGDFDFTNVYSFNDIDNSLQEIFHVEEYRGFISTNIDRTNITVSKDILFVGQQFYFVVTPYDSIDQGESKSSSVITVTSGTNN